MNINDKLLKMMEDFIDGKYEVMAFSFDFPDEMFNVEDDKVISILDDMPEWCSFYQEDEEERKKYPELLSEEQLREKTKIVYKKLKAYVESK